MSVKFTVHSFKTNQQVGKAHDEKAEAVKAAKEAAKASTGKEGDQPRVNHYVRETADRVVFTTVKAEEVAAAMGAK